jgi:hypothetical protein
MADDERRGGASQTALSLSPPVLIAAVKHFDHRGESSIFAVRRQGNQKCITHLKPPLETIWSGYSSHLRPILMFGVPVEDSLRLRLPVHEDRDFGSCRAHDLTTVKGELMIVLAQRNTVEYNHSGERPCEP